MPYLPQFTNPCWNESFDDLSQLNYSRNEITHDWYEGLFKNYEKEMTSRYQQGQRWRFRCLPYVYVIGR